jgi:hypothetical protein
VRPALVSLLLLAAACRQSSKPHDDSELAAYIPAGASIVAGIDVDRIHNTPIYDKLPQNFRDASYVLAAFDPPNLVTASRVQGRIVATTPKGAPPDLVQHATTAPIWIVVRGTAALPLTGNLSNVNRLIEQTDYTVVGVTLGEKAEFAAEGVCRTTDAAAHLERNVRAIATLARIPLDVRVEGATVHVTGSTAIEPLVQLLLKP